MKEIALYGVGGQGVVTAARILTLGAGVYDNQFAQSIPAFTGERRGTPVYAYVRLSEKPILIHSFIYEPDCIISFAWHATPWSELIAAQRKQFVSVVNLPSNQSEEFLRVGLGGYLDASRLTEELLGSRIPPNAAMLGAFAAVTSWVSIKAIVQAIVEFWPGEAGEKNALVATRAWEQTTIV